MSEPITREEMFLAKAAGEDVNIPEPITRKEQYLKKIAENGGGSGGGGGGSGLPPVTPADFGKSLQVVRDTPSYITIIPEQTIVLEVEGVYIFTNADATKFAYGSEIVVNINGVSYDGFIAGAKDEPSFMVGSYEFWIEDDHLNIYSEYGGTTTISMSAKSYSAKWEITTPLCIKLTGGDFPNSVTGGEVISGSVLDTIGNLYDGKPYAVSVFDSYGNYIPNAFVSPFGSVLDILLESFGTERTFYVASSSGGSPTTQIKTRPLTTYLLHVGADGTISGWW